MKYVFDPYLKRKDDPDNKIDVLWETNKNMSNARANFALVVLDNLVYVFGGIKSKGKGKSSHVPSTVDIITERYDVNSDTWENIAIDGAPSLGAFAWTSLAPKHEGQILVLGGTDGDIL